MRVAAALFTFVCLSACSMSPTGSGNPLAQYEDGWRQHQAELDADAIVQGMARAQQQAPELARSAR